MFSSTHAQDIARLIQLAIAPVFLLTAVSATLSVLASRIARIMDRGRALEARAVQEPAEGVPEELATLAKRARAIYWAMTLATVSAILVSLLIAFAFVGYLLALDLASTMALLFIAAMFAYTGALLCLLREVTMAILTFQLKLPSARPPRALLGR